MSVSSPGSGLVLASSSPRRKELLQRAGLRFRIEIPSIDESPKPEEPCLDYVKRMAVEKARDIEPERDGQVLAADTIGEFEGRILIKPGNREEARQMLTELSGRLHQVHTAFAVRDRWGLELHCETTQVEFRQLSPLEIEAYLDFGEGMDKAGAYAVQGRAAAFVNRISGSYTAVVGLPLAQVITVLQRRRQDLKLKT